MSNNCDDNQASANNATSRMKSSNSSQEDDDSESWDDAKALLNDDINHQLASDQVDSVTNKLVALQPISSSAYSSDQSSNHNASANQQSHQADSSLSELVLHEAIFKNDIDKINKILDDVEFIKQNKLVDRQDKHGNTALHLACMLGRPKEIVGKMLRKETKWSPDVKNLNRWTPFHEACSYGDREILKLMAQQLKDTMDDAIQVNYAKLEGFLEKTKNLRLVLKWEFQSWVPMISRFLPSDICVITKHGKSMRIDTGLLNFESLFWRKGLRDTYLLYSRGKWIVVDSKKKLYQYFEAPKMLKNIDDKVDEIMSSDILDIELKSSEMEFTRSTYGWIWKADKLGKVGPYNAALYDFSNVYLIWRKRREHLSDEDLKRNKLAFKAFANAVGSGKQAREVEADSSSADENNQTGGNQTDSDDQEEATTSHRESLPPPPPTNVTWTQYLEAEPGLHPILGRPPKCKVLKKPFKASVALSEEFPLSKHEFLDLLSVVPLKSFKKLKEFVEMKLPEGFPVRIDVPLFPFLSARITFEDFSFTEGPGDESVFTVPADYQEDNNLLPERFTSRASE